MVAVGMSAPAIVGAKQSTQLPVHVNPANLKCKSTVNYIFHFTPILGLAFK